MTSVRRLLNLWDQFEAQVGGLFLFISVLLVFLLIVLRSLSIGVSGLYEIATFCMIFSVMLTASLGIKRNIHVRIDILSNVVPATVGFALEIGAMLIVLIVAAYLSYSLSAGRGKSVAGRQHTRNHSRSDVDFLS